MAAFLQGKPRKGKVVVITGREVIRGIAVEEIQLLNHPDFVDETERAVVRQSAMLYSDLSGFFEKPPDAEPDYIVDKLSSHNRVVRDAIEELGAQKLFFSSMLNRLDNKTKRLKSYLCCDMHGNEYKKKRKKATKTTFCPLNFRFRVYTDEEDDTPLSCPGEDESNYSMDFGTDGTAVDVTLSASTSVLTHKLNDNPHIADAEIEGSAGTMVAILSSPSPPRREDDEKDEDVMVMEDVDEGGIDDGGVEDKEEPVVLDEKVTPLSEDDTV